MNKQQSLLLKKYIDLLHRWRVLLLVLLLVALPAALAYYIITPKVYEASSLLSYQQQSVNPNKMSPDLTTRIQDTVSTLTQIVTSRTNLEDLITSLDLYRVERDELPVEDVIEQMRGNISIEPSKRGDIFSITYKGDEPGKVVRVANALAAKFIEENLKYREERATETSSYTSDELEMAKTMMDRKEAAMRDYKLKYYNEMPDQRAANLSRLTSLQEQYQARQVNILELERTRVLIQEQIAARKKILDSAASVSSATSGRNNSDPESSYDKLQRMRKVLDTLLITYTESHPEVKRVRKIIEKLEAEGADTARPRVSSGRTSPQVDKDLLQLQAQLNKINIDIEAIELEKKQIDENIQQYEAWLAATPVREAEWSALTREYGQLKSHYDYLVAQDLQAKSMLNLERRQKGSQFKIVDPARFPDKPTEPDFLTIMGAAIVASLGLGMAVIMVIDFLDGSFRDPDDVENSLGMPVLSTIELISTPAEKRKGLYLSVGVGTILLTAVVLVIGLFWYAWSKGKIVF